MRNSINSPYWGGQPPSAGQARLPVQFSNGTSATLPTGTQQITEYGGPGATIPTGMNETSDYAGPGATMPAESQPTTHRGGHGSQGGQSQAQLAANQASGNPVEVGAGVWVYPNGQLVTGAQLQALNSASTSPTGQLSLNRCGAFGSGASGGGRHVPPRPPQPPQPAGWMKAPLLPP